MVPITYLVTKDKEWQSIRHNIVGEYQSISFNCDVANKGKRKVSLFIKTLGI